MRWWWIALCLAGSLWGQQVKLMTYNVENYNLEDRLVEGSYKQQYPKPEKQKAALVEVIKSENPDVLVMQEMGGPEYLAELQARLKKAGVDYPYSSVTQAADAKRQVAILSKYSLEATRYTRLTVLLRGEAKPVLRGLTEVRFVINGKSFWVYGIHLKSRRSSDGDEESQDYRTGEAEVIRDLIIRNRPQADAFFVMGDFNDSPRSSAVRRFLQRGKRELTEILPAVDSRGDVWTHYWRAEGSYSRIDYILASPTAAVAVVPGSARVVDHEATRLASDHRPVVATVEVSLLGAAK